MEKILVEKEKCDTYPKPYISIEWSTLLDELLEGRIPDLTKAASGKKIHFFQEKLDTLSKAMRIVDKYKEPKYILVGSFNGDLFDIYSATISADELAKAKLNLLLAIPEKLIPQLSITKEDKKILQKKFETEISDINSIKSLKDYCDKYKNHPLLNYQRHPYYDSMRSRLFNIPNKGPNSKLKFMELINSREKILLRQAQTPSLDMYK